MTSYQKRKEEIQELTAKKWILETEFTTLKNIILALAKGQYKHANMTLKHFEKNHRIPEREIEEIKNLIEKGATK